MLLFSPLLHGLGKYSKLVLNTYCSFAERTLHVLEYFSHQPNITKKRKYHLRNKLQDAFCSHYLSGVNNIHHDEEDCNDELKFTYEESSIGQEFVYNCRKTLQRFFYYHVVL